MAMIMPCACLAAGGKNRRGNAHCLSARVLSSPQAGKPAQKRAPSFVLNAPLAAGGKTGGKGRAVGLPNKRAVHVEERAIERQGTPARQRKRNRLCAEKRRSKEPRRYQPGLSSVLFVHGSSPGVQYSHSGEPLNNSIFDDTAINGSFFFEANYVHCMGISCFRSFLLRNRCRND